MQAEDDARPGRVWDPLRRLRRVYRDGVRRRALARILAGPGFGVLVVVGQRRSGNHLFLNWYMSQHPGPTLLFNNIPPGGAPLATRRQEWRPGAADRTPTLIFSYEDQDPEAVLAAPMAEFLQAQAGRIRHRTLALVLRDPRNLIASRIKKWPGELAEEAGVARVRQGYLRNAALAFGPPDVLGGCPLVPVLYNPLVAAPAYRARLAARLGIPPGDRGLDEVTNYGHGSSFERQSRAGRAQEMDVFNRWKAFETDPRFRAVFAEDRMAAAVADFDAAAAAAGG
jgi:hypothetical protein